MQNNEISTRITSLHWSHPSSVVFACKTATLGPELQVSMGLSSHLLFCAFTTATLWPELIVSMGPRPHLSLCACKNNEINIRITGLYGSQPSSVVYTCKTATLWPESQVSIAYSPHLWFFAFKTASLASELQVSMGPSPHLLFFLHSQQRHYDQN